MAIAASDLKFYASTSMPENDTAVSGGAIDLNTAVTFTDIAATDTVEALSSAAGDTMNLTITGRNAAGAIVSETKALTGVTFITFSVLGAIERFLKALLASAPTGTITIRRATGDVTIATIPPNKLGVRRLFYDSSSDVADVDRYEKIFARNEHGTLTLNNAALKLTGDPPARYRIGGAPAKGDTANVANRRTLPASVTFVDDNIVQGVPTGILASNESIGIWIHQDLNAGDAAHKAAISVELSGTST
jgi:hypothetical protein